MSATEQGFDPSPVAAELPRATLLDLLARTATAHHDLSATWHAALTERFGRPVADTLADQGWPTRRTGAASPDRLFFDDLRFTAFVAGLNPSMLTVATFDHGALPSPLRYDALWYRALVRARQLSPGNGPRVSTESPGRFRRPVESVKKRAINAGYPALLNLWRRLEADGARRASPGTLSELHLEDIEGDGLALLWNLSAIAYMMATDRWYSVVRDRYDGATARAIEFEVWVDRGVAERDLEIGLDAQGISGDGVAALLRGFQFAPGEVGILDVDFTLDGPDRGVLTHKTCPAILRMEHHDPERLAHCCEICVVAMPLSGAVVSQGIECRPLRIPPRRGPRDIACQWEYRRTPGALEDTTDSAEAQ